jgi:hypothetical protein
MALASSSGATPRMQPLPAQLESIRKKEVLILSRTRVVRELNSSQNPRYQAVLRKALADLDAQLAGMAGGTTE